MKKCIIYLNYIRAVPAILAYYLVVDRKCVSRDIVRNLGKHSEAKKIGSVFNLVSLLVFRKEFRNIFYYRVGKKSKLLAGVLNLFFQKKSDCEISGDIGPGLAIWHGHGTVLSCNRIGEDFSVWQGVTIGRNPKKGVKVDKPSFGDGCSVFSNAVVAGNIEIGDHVKIGAGAVCMKNVPSDSVVIGNPCTIRNYAQEEVSKR